MGVFLELGHFDKHSPTTWEKKARREKIFNFFCLETLKTFILNEILDEYNQGIFSAN